MRNFRELQIWERSHQLTLAIYRSSHSFPKEEIYGITAQLRRAGVSVPNNIAEGCGRRSNKDFARFLDIALGSLSEVEYLIFLSLELNFLEEERYLCLEKEINEIKRMIYSFQQKIR